MPDEFIKERLEFILEHIEAKPDNDIIYEICLNKLPSLKDSVISSLKKN